MIRFACPGCKRILSSRDEQAGMIVMCPQCGQRMHAPRKAAHKPDVQDSLSQRKPPKQRRVSRLVVVLALVGIAGLLTGIAGGLWLWTRSLPAEPEPIVEAEKTASPGSLASLPMATTSKAQPKPPTRVENKQVETKRLPKTVPVITPPVIEKTPPSSPPPPTVEAKEEIELADGLPPELPFDLVDAINVRRQKAGCEPIFLDAELSRACQAEAERLARHGSEPSDKPVSPRLPDAITAADAPLTAIEKWLQEPHHRATILEPRLRTFAAGYARNVEGRWFSVFDWKHGIDRDPPLESIPAKDAVIYPAAGQTRVPLGFPGNETPDPLPHTKDKLAGYPITVTFAPSTRVASVTAHLSNSEDRDIALWLSSPEKLANPDFANEQRNTICLIAKNPLRPNTHYRVEVSARIDGEPWSAKWGFLTVSEGEMYHEMAGTLLRTLNRLRRRAGLPLVRIDAELSRSCAAHARYLGLNTPNQPRLNWSAEQRELPGYTEEGAAAARSAAIQGGGGPLEAVNGLIDSFISRPQVLDPTLNAIGLGYTPFVFGGWIWVIQPGHGPIRNVDKEYLYPAPDQEGVPLSYPSNEVPTPIPAESKDRKAGYAITALFGPGVQVTTASATLTDDKGAEVAGWLSSPRKPAIAGFPQRSLCFLPRTSLRPNTRYTISFNAEINGRSWQRKWSFSTLQEPDRYSNDLAEKLVAQVNIARKATGLKPVTLDEELSHGCQSHARYLALNHRSASAQGLNVHRQDANLPGASAEGAQAAKESVIAIVLDPQSCVEIWMATLYHRIPLLEPNLERVGFGLARIEGNKWACVMNTGNVSRTPAMLPPNSRPPK